MVTNKKEINNIVNSLSFDDIKEILAFNDVEITQKIQYKNDYVKLLTEFLLKDSFINRFLNKLNKDECSSKIYNHLIWINNTMNSTIISEMYNCQLPKIRLYNGSAQGNLGDNYSLIQREIYKSWRGVSDRIFIDKNIVNMLKIFYPKPDNYELQGFREVEETKYTYNNENGILQFINIIEDMLKNNLVEFGKTNEKPLVKTIHMIKSSSNINEFYTDKKSNSLATDMCVRTIYYYFKKISVKKFKNTEYNTLLDVVKYLLDDKLRFFISRTFTTHLKGVRFSSYCSEKDLFNIMKLIINNLVSKEWVSIDNILNFLKYRDRRFYLENGYAVEQYRLVSDEDEMYGEDFYNEIFFEPVIKASLFYLGALGILELKYNEPKSNNNITAKGLPYISIWDSLEYVKITKLGLYIFGIDKTYKAKKIEKKELTIKFDEYKPILTIDKSDIITTAKIEPFTDKLDENRYILSYSKIFRDCKNYSALTKKIDNFYKIFDKKLPKVFDNYFDEIKENSNMLKRDLKLITIELKNNKKLLNLFISNKKLQELIIKASGYRILVLKDDIPKVSKIIKDNGFFIEF
ncbi:MAG: hypothetical protein U9Q30_06440 [Campylobacterota bacterium]|nr:hypothetical protein [Campylobacterota bacterium]